jgi:hypothetical protein
VYVWPTSQDFRFPKIFSAFPRSALSHQKVDWWLVSFRRWLPVSEWNALANMIFTLTN